MSGAVSLAGLLRGGLLFLMLLIAAPSEPLLAQDQATAVRLPRLHTFQPKEFPAKFAPVARAAASGTTGLSANVLQQIAAITLEKQSRPSTQRRIDSNLLNTVKMLQNQPVANGVPYLQTGVELDDKDNLFVNIIAEVSDQLVTRLTLAGVQILNSFPTDHAIQALVPPGQLVQIAGWEGIRFIRPVIRGTTSSVRTTEGDITHKANMARTDFGVNGTGVKIGVLSDGVLHLADSQASGALGPVTVLAGQAGPPESEDEGTAMLEIIHTLAPGADLYFATAIEGMEGFAQNIRNLRAAGCDIIVDDISYNLETAFQDGQTTGIASDTNAGIIIQAINDVVADGALYFTSATNDGNFDSFNPLFPQGTGSGTYENDFVDGGSAGTVIGSGRFHAFDPTSNPPTILNEITYGSGRNITLQWSDPLGGSCNDYDIFVIDATGTVLVGFSNNYQDCSQDPMEAIYTSAANQTGNLIVIAKADAAAPRFMHLSTNRARTFFGTSGATSGHSAAKQAFSVAATPAYLQQYPFYPLGPYPAPFSLDNLVEPFSADGPRRIFFQADGTPITPDDFASSGGLLLSKPDFAAADGVSVTGVGGFGVPFYGTSAAAPHAAAIAALIKSAKPGISNADVRTALFASAIDFAPQGWNRNAGAGIVMAYEAIASLSTVGYTLSGTVHSGSTTGPAIAGATVSTAGKTATTDASGTFSISGIPAGTYTLIISAAGYGTYSNSYYTVSADQIGLSLFLTPLPAAPTNVSATAGIGQATVAFTAAEGSAITSFTATSSPGGLTASGPVSPLTVSGLSNGTTYTFTVTATNAAGTGPASAPSNPVTPYSDLAPTLVVSTLADRAVTNNLSLNVTGTAAAGNGIRTIAVNGAVVAVNADGSFSAVVALQEGSNTVSTVATDNANIQITDTRTVIVDTTAPALTVSPADKSSLNSTVVTITGSVNDANLAAVSVTVDTSSPQPASVTGSGFTATVELAAGSHTIYVTATDLAGNSATVKRSVVVDLARPGLSITDPPQDATVHKSSYLLKGAVNGAAASTVSVTAAGKSYTAPVAADGTFQQAIAFGAEDSFAVTAQATDAAGNSTAVQRNFSYTLARTGDINGDETVDISDAVVALQIAIGNRVATQEQLRRGDVAPIVSGLPQPDGAIDAGDALVILRKAVNLVTW